MRTNTTRMTSEATTADTSVPQNIPELNSLVGVAKKKLDAVAAIFNGRDGKTTAQAESHIFNGKVFGRIYIKTTGESFDKEIEKQLIIASLELQGGFASPTVVLRDGGNRMLVRAVYDGRARVELRHKEHTIADLLQFVKDHRREFPNGLLTKIALGDYEGNTFHRRFSACEDSGRLLLSFELNECDDA